VSDINLNAQMESCVKWRRIVINRNRTTKRFRPTTPATDYTTAVEHENQFGASPPCIYASVARSIVHYRQSPPVALDTSEARLPPHPVSTQ